MTLATSSHLSVMGLKQFVDGLEFDHFPHVRFFPKKLAHGTAHHTISIRFKLVNLLTGLQRRRSCRRISDLCQH